MHSNSLTEEGTHYFLGVTIFYLSQNVLHMIWHTWNIIKDLDDQDKYSQKKKWSIEAEPEMIPMSELSDRSGKLNLMNALKDLVENMQEHMGISAERSKWLEK